MWPLCLLLLLAGTTGALHLEGGRASHTSAGERVQEVAEMKQHDLLTRLAWWHEWVSQASASPFLGGRAREAPTWQEGPPPQQARSPDKAPCKNFFWKTFSSCK